jgi:hypothetical protein
MPKTKAEVIEIHHLAKEIETVKDVHLAHIHECIHRVEDELKSNKEHFNTRIDKLDNRIFWVLGLTVSTLVSIIASMIV